MYELEKELFSIYRCLTGKGVRDSLNLLSKYLEGICELNVYEVKSGTKVFDWNIPKEWELRDAFLEKDGKRVIGFEDNCLFVMGYSLPIDKTMSFDELKSYIFTQPDQPDAIPYVTSYYKDRVGICMSEKQKCMLEEGLYHLKIDSRHFDGSLTYADVVLPGKTKKEIVFSTYICHPSMANDNCSGIVVASELIKYIASYKGKTRYTYRFIFVPETIGAIAYLAEKDRYKEIKKNFIAGYTLSCVGDNREFSIIHSKEGNVLSDRALISVLREDEKRVIKEYSFLERGSDERQYNSPVIGLTFAGFCRSKYWTFPEYHTSLDDLNLVTPEGLQGSYDVLKDVIYVLENNGTYVTVIPCEPQLGRRGLYSTISQKGNARTNSVTSITDFIAYADGTKDLIEISETIRKPIKEVVNVSKILLEEGIIKEI